MYKLTKEDVLHVASLSKLNIENKDIEKYQKDLEDILNSINKIESLNIDSNIMITPSENEDVFSNYSNNKDIDVLSNAKERVGNFIKVEDMR